MYVHMFRWPVPSVLKLTQHCTPRILPDKEENRKTYKSAVYCIVTRPLRPGVMSIPGAWAGWEARLERPGPRELGGRGQQWCPLGPECLVPLEGTRASRYGWDMQSAKPTKCTQEVIPLGGKRSVACRVSTALGGRLPISSVSPDTQHLANPLRIGVRQGLVFWVLKGEEEEERRRKPFSVYAGTYRGYGFSQASGSCSNTVGQEENIASLLPFP